MSNSSVSKICLKVLRSLADLQLYDSEFQTEGALTQNAFADTVSNIRGTASSSLSADRRVRAGWYPWTQKFRIGTSFFLNIMMVINNMIIKKGINYILSDGKSTAITLRLVAHFPSPHPYHGVDMLQLLTPALAQAANRWLLRVSTIVKRSSWIVGPAVYCTVVQFERYRY